MINRMACLPVSAALLLLLASPAWSAAEDAAPPTAQAQASRSVATAVAGPEQVIVRSTRRVQKILDVPGPITAISARQIEANRLRDPRDYLALVPSAFLDEGDNSGSEKNFSIRGVSTPTIFAEPGVALYIDDIFSNGFISYPTQLHDIDQIEVLRGPQGALYGRDAVGGAVNIISKRPIDLYESGFTATWATYDRIELDAFGNFPVNDKVRVRLAAWGVDQFQGEYYNQRLSQYIDRTDTAGGRATVTVDPRDDVHITAIVEHTQGNVAGTYLYFPGAETKSTILRDTQPINYYDTTRYATNAQYDSAFGTFNLIVGGRDYALIGVEDTDLSDYQTLAHAPGQEITRRQDKVSSTDAELRYASPQFGPVSFLAGIVYLDEAASGRIQTDLPTYAKLFRAPFGLDINNVQSLTSWAGYVEATWKITPQVGLIADARYSTDSKSDDFSFRPTATAAAFIGRPASASPSKDFFRFSPGGTLAWTPAPLTRLYARIQTGFRAGGYNFNVASVADLPYGQETSENYEIGAKQGFLDGRAYLALTAYRLDQHDVLVSTLDVTQPGPLESYLVNAGQARTYGAELEGSVTPLSGLQLSASGGYQDAQFTSGTQKLLTPLPLDGRTVPGARRWTLALLGAYRVPVSDSLDLLLNAAYTYRGETFADVQQQFKLDAADLINLSVGLAYRKYEIRAYVQNLLDNDYIIAYGGVRADVTGLERAPGRTAGVTVTAKF